jgi:hypothetical protein
MGTKNESSKKNRSLRDVWRLIAFVLAVVAVVQELRKPADERTWHGKLGDFVPYDFRKPTMERFRATYWDPEGPVLAAKAWGVGWAPNFGAVAKLVGR